MAETTPSPETPPAGTLVVGYGNELRGDDGAGPAVARAVERAALPGVEVHLCHQLTPELVDLFARFTKVIFVDATVANTHTILVEALPPPALPNALPSASDLDPNGDDSARTPLFAHVAGPAGLLRLTQLLHGHAPRAWSIGVPCRSFALAAPLSSLTRQAVHDAVREIQHLCTKSDSSRPRWNSPTRGPELPAASGSIDSACALER